jgi:hypothetical protein
MYVCIELAKKTNNNPCMHPMDGSIDRIASSSNLTLNTPTLHHPQGKVAVKNLGTGAQEKVSVGEVGSWIARDRAAASGGEGGANPQ